MECTCNAGMQNPRSRSCDIIPNQTRGIGIMATFANDGTRNKIAADDTLNEAYFQALVNHADPSKRLYILNGLEYLSDVRETAKVETTDAGTKIPIQDGVRSFKATLTETAARILGKLESFGCNEISIFKWDNQSTLTGKTDGTDFYPQRLASKTFQSLLSFATADKSQNIEIMFDYHYSEKDSDIRHIKSSTMGNVDFSILESLLDVTVAITAITATGFVATLKGDEDEFGVDFMIEGWLLADFLLKKAGVAVTPTSVTETSAGVYTFVVPTSTGSHTLEKAATKTGYEMPTATVLFP